MSLAAADFSQIPMSQNLGTTLARASDVANSFGAAEVALEHMLLALCDDPDAEAVLMASRVDVQHLKAETHGYLNSLPRQQSGPGFGVSQALSRILEAAAAAARGSRRRDINGAIVLAAIVGEGRSAAAQILQVHGLTFDEAIRALQAALATPPRETLPEIKPADDVLARARERVQSRAAPGLRDMMRDAPRPALPPPPPAPPPMASSPASAEIFPQTAPVLAKLPEIESAPSIDHTIPPTDSVPQVGPAPVDEPAFEIPGSESVDAAIGSGGRIEPSFETGISEPERPIESVPHLEPTSVAAARPAQATDFGYSAAPPPNAASPAAPARAPAPSGPGQGFPFDLQRPAPIAVPPPIPPMSAPSAPSGYRGGLPGMPVLPNAPYAPQPMPQQRGPAPSFPGDPFGYPPMAPQRPMGAPMPPGPYGHPGGAPAPSARDLHMPSPPPAQQQPQRRAARTQVETGQLSENIPRAMRVGKTESVEVRIGKAAAKAITQGLEGGGVAWRHEVTVTQAMSVRLRAPDGGFFIETASPETQWIENNLGLGSDDFASWRFHITPQMRGWSRLQIIVSARTIGSDGMAAETALPDQLVDVKVRTNYKRTFARWTGWTLAAIVGGILAKFGEGTFAVVAPLVEKLMK